jgi:hypothetical protein
MSRSRVWCGGSGIRTHGGLRLTAFQELRICPLCHPSRPRMLGEIRQRRGSPWYYQVSYQIWARRPTQARVDDRYDCWYYRLSEAF